MKSIVNRVFFTLTLFVVIGASILYGLYNGYIRFNYPSFDTYPVQGIDVSHHQNEIEWHEINKSKIRFVFIKATEGGDFIDELFEKNWLIARQQGFIIGAYHFFTFCRSGEDQARNYIQTVPKSDNMLPPAIDLEYGGNCQLKKGKEQLLSDINIMIKMLEKTYNKKPILYVTYDFFNDFLTDQFNDNPIWIRDIYRFPELKKERPWLFWQYANRGRLDGIKAPVDLNVFNGTADEFEKFIKN